MKTNDKRSIAVLAIIFVAFSVIAFALPFAKNGVFRIAYIFAVVSIALAGYAAYLGFVKGDKARSKLYGFPIARLGVVYMLVQLVLSIVFMALAKLAPVWLELILCVLALGAASIGLITTEAMREEIERQDVQIKNDVAAMRALQSKTRTLAAQCTDEAMVKELKALSEEMQYSDPVSSEEIADIEAELTALVDELQKAVIEADPAAAQLCRRARSTLAERNRLCKLHKA